IPSLLLSTAAAIMVTRVSTSEDMGGQVKRQMLASPKALGIAAAIMIVMGLIPGMPHLSFLSLGAMAAVGAYFIANRQRIKAEAEQAAEQQQAQLPALQRPESRELGWDDVTPVDMVGLEVGYRLIPLVDRSQGG